MQGRHPEIEIILKDKDKKVLKSYLRKTKTEYRYVLRSKIILLASENKYRNQEIADKLGCTRQIVYKWKKRFNQIGLKGLEDSSRDGRPIIFTAKQRAKIMALATTKPEDKGLNITDWSSRELADYAVEKGIVPSIHWTTVGDWLKGADIKPHRWEYWLNSKDPDFEKKMLEIIELYELAQDYYEKNILLVCIDQKTGIQALERLFPDMLVKPGRIKRIEHSYDRHGIRNLIGGFVVATGKVFGKLYGRNRNFELTNYLTHLFNKYHTYDKIHIILDNYGTATHLNTCLHVAKFCNVKISKGKLKTKKQRAEFLKSKKKWVEFHFLPTHASWLNQIEIWFSILHRKIIKKGNFASIKQLDNKIMSYIENEWNQKNVHPFQWTYKGKVCYA